MGILSKSNPGTEVGEGLENRGKRLSWEHLSPGAVLAEVTYLLEAPLVDKYTRAVKGDSSVPGHVPPTAIAAYAMAALAKSLVLPPGTIHAAQELDFMVPVPIGVSICCRGKVAQKVNRGKLRMLIIDLEAVNGDGLRVFSGRSTLVLPG